MANQNGDETENLALPYIMPQQAQKHVTHNEAIRMLDAVVQLSVHRDDLTAPPGAPEAGARYIIGQDPTDVWAGRHNHIAAWQDGNWTFFMPKPGWLAYVVSRDQLAVFDGEGWVPASSGGNGVVARLGINTTSDETNRLAVKADAVLLSHDDVTPGHGDIRITVNKAEDDKTASLLFQSAWSGRAEIGLSGNNSFALNVSGDGANWMTALTVDAANGTSRFGGAIRLGGTTADHDLHDFRQGEWLPVLGTLAGGDYSGATGLTVHYGRFTKIGQMVTIMTAFRVNGVGGNTLTAKSSLMLEGLPYPVNDLFSGVDQGGAVGFIYGSFGGANNSPLIGGFGAPGRLYLCAMASGANDAASDDTHFVTATYLTT